MSVKSNLPRHATSRIRRQPLTLVRTSTKTSTGYPLRKERIGVGLEANLGKTPRRLTPIRAAHGRRTILGLSQNLVARGGTGIEGLL